MYLIAENLVNHWDVIKDEFKKTKTLKDKRLLIAMMYQPWELCDDTFTEWSADNKITLPAKPTFCTVAAKYLYSDWVWLLSEDWFYYCSERNNVVVLFGTLKVQSFILTEVSDCGVLIVVTSSTFLKRKDMLKEKSS